MHKLEQAMAMMREQAAESAKQKLGRNLTEAERTGLETVKSLMMLEAICQGFASERYPPERVAADLASMTAKI